MANPPSGPTRLVLASSNASPVPFEIPGYRIEREIGRGGMATVYLAIQENLDREVALKVMVAARTIDPSFRERFIKEAKIVGRLTHPHIVTVYDIGSVESRYYIAMEYVGAENLKHRLQRDAIERPLAVTTEIARALGYAHARGFIHRDVKPANILFREDGSVVLSDFGIAKALTSSSDLTALGYTVGTPEYMSPEQATGKAMDGRSDLYSLGVVFFEMLTRRKPFQAEDAFATALMHINSPCPRLPEHFGLYQPLLDRLLAKDPGERFESAEQLVEAISGLSKEVARVSETAATRLAPAEAAVAERPKTPQKKASRRSRPVRATEGKRRFGRGFLAVSLLLVAGLGGASVYLGGTRTELSFAQLLSRWSGSSSSQEQAVASDEAPPAVATDRPFTDELPPLPEAASSSRDPILAQKVARLLEVAQAHAAFGRLKDPPGFNAYDAYQQVLELDPDNEDALRGLSELDRDGAAIGQ